MELTEIEKLTPEAKTKELKKLIEMLKKEIQQKQQHIKDAEEMLQRSEEDLKVLENIQVPEQAVQLSETAPETLEKMIDPHIEQRRQEIEQMAHRPTTEIYQTIRDIYMQTGERGYATQQEQKQIYLANQALEHKRKEIETGEYEPTEKAEHLMTAAEMLIKQMYKT